MLSRLEARLSIADSPALLEGARTCPFHTHPIEHPTMIAMRVSDVTDPTNTCSAIYSLIQARPT